ncbi:hypothetical protein ScPMuIL_002758 [Solemya velum]
MKCLLLFAFVILAEGVTHTHVPNIIGTPNFLYDLHTHAIFVDAGTACYLAHLNHDEREMVQTPTSLATLENHVVQQITSGRAYKQVHKLGHYSHSVREMCAHKAIYEFHMTHLDNVTVINHSPNITDITPTEFLFDRNQHIAAIVTAEACYVANLGNHEQDLLDTSGGVHTLEAILKRDLIPGAHYVAVDSATFTRYGQTIVTACSGLDTYSFHLTHQ